MADKVMCSLYLGAYCRQQTDRTIHTNTQEASEQTDRQITDRQRDRQMDRQADRKQENGENAYLVEESLSSVVVES